MKTINLILYLFLLNTFMLQAQDCGECGTREVRVFYFDIKLPRPTVGHDSIIDFYNAIMISQYVSEYYKGKDEKSGCLTVLDSGVLPLFDTVRALRQPSMLAYLADFNTGPWGAPPDYFIKGEVTPNDNSYNVRFDLRAGPEEELVTAGSGTLLKYPAGNPEETANSMCNLGFPLFDLIMHFEELKRAMGEPYAIKPTLTGEASKTVLDFNETTTISFTLIDCDQEPLKNRTITFTATGGTLDKTSVTTDDNGKADIKFTAGTNPEIALVTPGYSFKKPSNNPGTIDLEPVEIQIRKPPDAWFFKASFTFLESRRSKSTSTSLPCQLNSSNAGSTNFISGWIKQQVLPFPSPDVFVSNQDAPINLKFMGSSNETGESSSSWSNECCYIQENSRFSYQMLADPKASPKIYISINPSSFAFNFTKINANRTGSSSTFKETYTPFEGKKTSESTSQADPDGFLNWDVNGHPVDTAYQSVETTDTETVTNMVTQTCKWENKVFTLTQYKRHLSRINTENEASTEESTWMQDFTFRITLYYNPPSAGIDDPSFANPSGIVLRQNYPNPFLNSTTVSYEIFQPGPVKLRVYNLVGKEVAELVNEEKVPGKYQARFDGIGLPQGIYFCRLDAGKETETIKLTLFR